MIYSGHSGYISVTFNSLAPHYETLEIFVDGIKQTKFKLWYSDISVSLKLVRIGDKYSIVYRVKNNGYLSNKFTLTANYVAEGTENKTVIWEQVEFDLLPNAFEFGTIELKDNLGNYYSGSYLVELSVNANDEFNTVNNTSQVAVNTNTVSQDIKNKFTEILTEATNFESGKIVYTNCSNASDSFTITLYALFDIDRNTVVNALDLLACRKKILFGEECDLNADDETNTLDLIKFKKELANNF